LNVEGTHLDFLDKYKKWPACTFVEKLWPDIKGL